MSNREVGFIFQGLSFLIRDMNKRQYVVYVLWNLSRSSEVYKRVGNTEIQLYKKVKISLYNNN